MNIDSRDVVSLGSFAEALRNSYPLKEDIVIPSDLAPALQTLIEGTIELINEYGEYGVYGEGGYDDDDCNSCALYDVLNGVCKLTGDNHHGYDEACESFKRETDTSFGKESA